MRRTSVTPHMFEKDLLEGHRISLHASAGKRLCLLLQRIGIAAGENGNGASILPYALGAIGPRDGSRLSRKDYAQALVLRFEVVENAADNGAAAVDNRDAVGNLLDLGQLVRGEEDGGAVCGRQRDQFAQ